MSEVLGISPEDLDKELHQFYEDRKKELERRIEIGQKNTECECKK